MFNGENVPSIWAESLRFNDKDNNFFNIVRSFEVRYANFYVYNIDYRSVALLLYILYHIV